MRLKVISVLSFSIFIILCIICGCSTSDSDWVGTKNKVKTEAAAISKSPVFSDMGGFYSGEFELEISVPKIKKNAAKPSPTSIATVKSMNTVIIKVTNKTQISDF